MAVADNGELVEAATEAENAGETEETEAYINGHSFEGMEDSAEETGEESQEADEDNSASGDDNDTGGGSEEDEDAGKE